MALLGYGVISVDGSMLVGPYLLPAAMGEPMATSCLSFCLAHSQTYVANGSQTYVATDSQTYVANGNRT